MTLVVYTFMLTYTGFKYVKMDNGKFDMATSSINLIDND